MERRRSLSTVALTVVSGFVLVWLGSTAWFWKSASASDGSEPPVLLDPGVNPHALLTFVFAESGYTQQEAVALATRSIKIAQGEEVDDVKIGPKPEGTVLLDPDANIHGIFYVAFLESGWTSSQAVKHATSVMMDLLGIEPEPFELNPLGDECWACSLAIVYCDGEDKKRTFKWVRGLCWEDVEACFDKVPKCPGTEDPWLTHSLSCEDISCAWIKKSGECQFVSCNWVNFGCECLFDGGQVDCEALPPLTCGDLLNACPGCPECD